MSKMQRAVKLINKIILLPGISGGGPCMVEGVVIQYHRVGEHWSEKELQKYDAVAKKHGIKKDLCLRVRVLFTDKTFLHKVNSRVRYLEVQGE
jgi:hypothetical protein